MPSYGASASRLPQAEQAALVAQIQAHPDYARLARMYSRHRGSHIIPPRELQALGFTLPAHFGGYDVDTHALYDDRASTSQKIIVGLGAGILGLGAAGLAGVGPLAGGAAPAGATVPAAGAAVPATAGGGAALDTAIAGAGAGVSSIPAGGEVPKSAGLRAPPGGGADLLSRIMRGIQDYGPSALAGVNAARQLTQGPPPAQDALERMLGLSEDRVRASEPLFQALNAMARSRLPDQYRR
jgi:hypothetical protein